MLNWTWTAQVFFTLHTLTILMKVHSYAFYNGHLSETERRLWALDNPETASTAAAVKYPSSSTKLSELDQEKEDQKHQDEREALTQLREDLALELTSPLGHVTYPQNLTLGNYADYILCPTLCYELEYPRTIKTHWMELFWKVLAVFGCIFLLMITSEEFIVPVLHESAVRLEGVESLSEKALILAESISMLLFPFMVTLLLVFLVIFEYILGAFAEITCFADRHFYSDWWNSCDWYVLFSSFLTSVYSEQSTGSNSPANGTSQSITSSDDTSTVPLALASPAPLPPSSLSLSAPSGMNWSWAASRRNSGDTASSRK